MASKASGSSLCFRHPTVEARRRCYSCRRPICPQCQRRVEGHIFCSEECAQDHKRTQLWHRLVHLNRTALTGHWFRAVIFGAVLLAGLLAVWVARHADEFMTSPEAPLPAFKKEKEKGIDYEKLNWDTPGSVYIEAPASGEVLKVNRVEVAGRAPAEAMVGLYVNGEKVDVRMAADGTWSFSGVPLTGARNILQARYFDNRGNSAFGPAVWVDLAAAPAPAAVFAQVPAPVEEPAGALNLVRGPAGGREVYLTFDGGSNANATPAILDTLAKEKVRASFFLTGEYMQRYPDLVRRIESEGHLVGNHTFSHPHLTTISFNGRQNTLSGVTEEFLRGQLQRANELFRLITGKPMTPYWRAPFGEVNGQILRWGRKAGYAHVLWTPHLDTMDWVSSPSDPLFKTPQQILAALLKQEARGAAGVDGGIVLMHLGTERSQEMRADLILGDLIARLKGKSYTFGAVDEVGR